MVASSIVECPLVPIQVLFCGDGMIESLTRSRAEWWRVSYPTRCKLDVEGQKMFSADEKSCLTDVAGRSCECCTCLLMRVPVKSKIPVVTTVGTLSWINWDSLLNGAIAKPNY